MTSHDIRRQFIDFFVAKHGHTFVPSSPVVPSDDPTLLFTNAGMNQFKPIFLGTEKRPYVRAVNTQKCIRAGGKHNDLDDVGRSRRHGTFFEMLGNWSFGDYFKAEAIEWAWELLTKHWKLDPTRLHVSCYEGDEKNGVPRDTEAAELWKKIGGLGDDHIHFFGKDNFWEMGETGPCGPCSEIHIDRTPDKSGGKLVNGEDPRVMEFWNLVFIQYNRNADRSLTPLPAKHVDTGMGFERICQILQGKDAMYAIDLFDPFWQALTDLTGIRYAGTFPKTNVADPVAEAANPQLRHDIAFRVIADHIRTLTFAITDGAVPDKDGRGYVLRRILRRAAFFGRQHLGLRELFVHTLVPVVVQTMGDAFPELKKDPARIAAIIKSEEESFDRTIDRGLDEFAQAAKAGRISGKQAFELHATYGFPIDLTKIMSAERGVTIDEDGYKQEMEKHREISSVRESADAVKLHELPPAALAELSSKGVKPTDDSAKFGSERISATVRAIWDGTSLVNSTGQTGNKMYAIILDRTNFYAEMGGQVGDQGELLGGANFVVKGTHAVGGYVLHVGFTVAGALEVGGTVEARGVSTPRREATQQNHTATHLANWALREVLGDEVQQKGSLVDPEKLRFDFSHGKSMSDDEIVRVEKHVTDLIGKKLPVYAQEAPQQDALKITGLRAVFGEKYPPMVRVVSIGAPVSDLIKNPADPKWRQYSVEFCGGTHLKNSAEVEDFVITLEESISKGIRRIIALTGEHARKSLAAERELENTIAKAQATAEAQLPATLNALQKQLSAEGIPLRAKRRANAAIAALQQKHRAWEKSQKSSASSNIDVASVASDLASKGPIVVASIDGASDDALRAVIDSIKKRTVSFGVMLGATDGQKVSFVAAVSDDLIAKGLKAGDWIRETAKVAGGGGGGRPQMAQAGGKDPSKLGEALEVAKKYAHEKMRV